MEAKSSGNSPSRATTRKRTNGPATTRPGSATGSSPKMKSSAPSAKKASKKSKRSAVRKSKAGSGKGVSGGRPMLFPDRTICRLPKGSLKSLAAIAKRKKITQGEAVREAVGGYVKANAA